jgi:hypothetical protein
VRTIFTTLLMLFAGMFTGGMVAQVLAEETGADQEFILVFMLVMLVLLLSTVVFVATQFFDNPRRAANRAAFVLLGLIVLWAAFLVGWDIVDSPPGTALKSSWPIITGLTLPNAVTVIVHWLIARWRGRRAQPQFGRGPEATG